MQIKSEFTVMGARWFKGNVDGTDHDFTKLVVQMPMSEQRGTAVGFNVVEMAFGPASEGEKFKNLPFPIKAELDLLLTTKGYEVKGFRPLAAANPAKAG